MSEYAQEFNKKYKRSGSLFRQKTKYKIVDNGDPRYLNRLFFYILRNPIDAKLVSHLVEWELSSYQDLMGERVGNLCDLEMCNELFQFAKNDLEDIGAVYDEILYLTN